MNLLLLSLFALSHAHAETPVQEYVNRFNQAMNRHVGAKLSDKYLSRLQFRVKHMAGLDDAKCMALDNVCSESRMIILDSYMWSIATDLYKEMVMFHELGHCILFRLHDERMRDGRPMSMMTRERLTQSVYLAHRNEYHRELFKRLPHFLPNRKKSDAPIGMPTKPNL